MGASFPEYVSVKLRKTLVERVNRIIQKHPEYGYGDINDFLEDAVTSSLRRVRRAFYLYVVVFVAVSSVLAYLVLRS